MLVALTALAGCESERAKWNLARATHLIEKGKTQEAVELMHTALEQSPDQSRIKLTIAGILAENGRGEMGVCLCDQYLQDFPNSLDAIAQRATCRQYIGQFEEALADYKKSISDHVGRTIEELNSLAYLRALANTELTKAANDIQEAIEKHEAKTGSRELFLTLQIQTVVCAGFVSRHTDQREEVLDLLDQKIEQFNDLIYLQKSLIFGQITDEIQTDFPLSAGKEERTRHGRSVKKTISDCLAAMLGIRALIYEDLGKPELADADRRKITELGFEFKRLMAALPSDQVSPQLMHMGLMYLDTRGFVLGRQPWKTNTTAGPSLVANSTSTYYKSIEDLDVAVLAAQINQKALETEFYNTVEIPAHQIEARKRMANRLTAVLLRHRMEVHERGERKELAKQDEQQIEALGLKPDSNLF